MRKLEGLTASMNRAGLQELLNGLARSQPVEGRAAFFAKLTALAEKTDDEQPEPSDSPDALVARIEELAEEAAERQESIENGDYHALSDWDEDEYYRSGSWHDEPEVFSEDICEELTAIRTQADHWVLDEAYGRALPVYSALFDLEKRALEDEFYGAPYVCTMETGVNYCRCVCRVASGPKCAEALLRAIVRVAESVSAFARMDGSRVVPLHAVEDLFDDWTGLQKAVDQDDSWIAMRLAAELLVRCGDEDALESRLSAGGFETGPAWIWFLHNLHEREQWLRLAECSRKAVGLLEDWFRTEALKMQVLAGVKLDRGQDVADGLYRLFCEQPTRENLAETVFRLCKQPERMTSVLEQYESFLNGKGMFRQLLALTRILLGRFDEVFVECVKTPDPLSWTNQSPCGIAAAAAFLRISRTGKNCPPVVLALVERYLLEPSVHRWEESSDSAVCQECNHALNNALSQALSEPKLAEKQEASFLEGLCDLLSKRADAIVSAKYRGSYGKAAEGLVAWAEASQMCGETGAGEELIKIFRQRYNRHSAFKKELQNALDQSTAE